MSGHSLRYYSNDRFWAESGHSGDLEVDLATGNSQAVIGTNVISTRRFI